MAAHKLSESGLKVVVLEKQRLPRYKPCGGLMSGGLSKLVAVPLDKFSSHEVSRFDFLYNFKEPHCLKGPNYSLLLADRRHFDSDLLHSAIKRSRGNITLVEDYQVKQVDEVADQVIIEAEGRKQVIASLVIAADGAMSRTARCLKLGGTHDMAVAIDAEVRVTPDFYAQVSDRVIFNYFVLPVGYGWIFPKGNDVLSCGVGSWATNHRSLNQAMKQYLEQSIPHKHILEISQMGFPLPSYSGRTPIASRRVCLTGDAAGLVDPVTGEGIRYALLSGMMAAEAACNVLLDANSIAPQGLDCSEYQQKIDATLGTKLDKIYRFAGLPFRQAPEYYYRKFIAGGMVEPYQGDAK